MHNQQCGYWCPGAHAPGHWNPQCWLSSHCIGSDLCKMTIWAEKKLETRIKFWRKWAIRLRVIPLWPSDSIWLHRTGSTLAEVMACCLMTPSHYLNQCWCIISRVPWHSSEGIIITCSEDTNQKSYIENCIFKNPPRSPRYQWVKLGPVAQRHDFQHEDNIAPLETPCHVLFKAQSPRGRKRYRFALVVRSLHGPGGHF